MTRALPLALASSIALSLAACGRTTPPAPGPPPASGLWVSGYYVGYERYLYAPAQVDFTAITHLIVGTVIPNADGTLDTTFYQGTAAGPGMARDLAARAHGAGRKAILMIGGAGYLGGFQGAASAANRATFVANLVAARADLGFDGYDLDWEPVQDADKPALLALTQALRAADPAALITIPVDWADSGDTFYSTLAPSVDQINIMSYGMAGLWGGWDSWHFSALAGEGPSHPSSVSSRATAFAATGIPRSKIGIGIGFYGQCWQGVTGPRQPLTGASIVAGDGTMSYAKIMTSYWTATAYQWDAAASQGSLSFAAQTGPAGCTWVSYEDPASIQAKGAWVRANGFGGTIIWTVNQGYVAGSATNPPLDAVKAAFLQ